MMENRRCWCILLSYRLQPSWAGLIAEVMVTPGYNPHLTRTRVRAGAGHDLLGAQQEIFSIIQYRLYSWPVRQADRQTDMFWLDTGHEL